MPSLKIIYIGKPEGGCEQPVGLANPTLGSQPVVVPKNLPNHWFQGSLGMSGFAHPSVPKLVGDP